MACCQGSLIITLVRRSAWLFLRLDWPLVAEAPLSSPRLGHLDRCQSHSSSSIREKFCVTLASDNASSAAAAKGGLKDEGGGGREFNPEEVEVDRQSDYMSDAANDIRPIPQRLPLLFGGLPYHHQQITDGVQFGNKIEVARSLCC